MCWFVQVTSKNNHLCRTSIPEFCIIIIVAMSIRVFLEIFLLFLSVSRMVKVNLFCRRDIPLTFRF
jgi:hypothetical protein